MSAVCDHEEYVGLNEACRRSGRSIQWVQRQAIIGKVRTLIEPGEKPHYNAADLDRFGSRPNARVA